jgi:hypothetical protein
LTLVTISTSLTLVFVQRRRLLRSALSGSCSFQVSLYFGPRRGVEQSGSSPGS